MCEPAPAPAALRHPRRDVDTPTAGATTRSIDGATDITLFHRAIGDGAWSLATRPAEYRRRPLAPPPALAEAGCSASTTLLVPPRSFAH